MIGVAQKRIQHHSGNTLEIINAEAGDLFSLLGSAWNRELLYRNARKRAIRVSTHKDLITVLLLFFFTDKIEINANCTYYKVSNMVRIETPSHLLFTRYLNQRC